MWGTGRPDTTAGSFRCAQGPGCGAANGGARAQRPPARGSGRGGAPQAAAAGRHQTAGWSQLGDRAGGGVWWGGGVQILKPPTPHQRRCRFDNCCVPGYNASTAPGATCTFVSRDYLEKPTLKVYARQLYPVRSLGGWAWRARAARGVLMCHCSRWHARARLPVPGGLCERRGRSPGIAFLVLILDTPLPARRPTRGSSSRQPQFHPWPGQSPLP